MSQLDSLGTNAELGKHQHLLDSTACLSQGLISYHWVLFNKIFNNISLKFVSSRHKVKDLCYGVAAP